VNEVIGVESLHMDSGLGDPILGQLRYRVPDNFWQGGTPPFDPPGGDPPLTGEAPDKCRTQGRGPWILMF
jgi:hypothetical protein